MLDLIANALGVEHGEITRESALGQTEAWDSIGHLDVLLRLDEIFHGELAKIDELKTAKSAGEIIDLIKRYGLL